jgi:hypothetical protein
MFFGMGVSAQRNNLKWEDQIKFARHIIRLIALPEDLASEVKVQISTDRDIVSSFDFKDRRRLDVVIGSRGAKHFERETTIAANALDIHRLRDYPIEAREGPNDGDVWAQLPWYMDFWRRWHDGFAVGRPLSWELQRAVALIPYEDWEKGPEHIARLIEEIEARLALTVRIRELEDELSLASRDRLGIGGNLPPEAIEDAPSIAKEFTIIWAPLQDLKLEAKKAQPNRTIVQRAAELLRDALVACGLWTKGKVDAAATAAFIAAGTASGSAFVAWMTGHGDKVIKVVEAAEAWLNALR